MGRRLSLTLLLVLTALHCAPAPKAAETAAVAPACWDGLEPGAHRVGYHQVVFPDGAVHIWYPTLATDTTMTMSGYLMTTEPLVAFLAEVGLAPSTIDSMLACPLYAQRDAAPTADSFPLVLIAQGNGGDAMDQAILAEYLASQGFVVATTPSPMLRMPMQSEEEVGKFAEFQAGDLGQAITMASSFAPVQSDRIGVVGHSFGARAALLLAMKNSAVRVLVSLDGGIGTATAMRPFRGAPSFNADAKLPPLLHFYEELDSFMTPDFGMLNSLHFAELVLRPTTEMHHTHFTTYGFLIGRFPALAEATHATAGTSVSVPRVAVGTAAFLKKNLAAVK